MKKFEAIFVAANRWVLIGLLAAMSVIVFTNVVLRYLTDGSISWSEEVARHMMLWLTFLGGGLVLRSGGHIAIDNLQDALPASGARLVRWLVLVIMVAFLGLMTWYGCIYVELTMVQTTASTEIPIGLVYAAMPIGCILMLIHLALIAPEWLRSRTFAADENFDATASASL